MPVTRWSAVVAAGAATDPVQRNNAITAVVFYLLTYAVMNIGAFAVVQLIARSGDRRTAIEDYRGIGFESPVLAFSLSLFMLSLLGMPLTADSWERSWSLERRSISSSTGS